MTRLAARGRLDEAIRRGDLRPASRLSATPDQSMPRRMPPLPLGPDVPEGQETNPTAWPGSTWTSVIPIPTDPA